MTEKLKQENLKKKSKQFGPLLRGENNCFLLNFEERVMQIMGMRIS